MYNNSVPNVLMLLQKTKYISTLLKHDSYTKILPNLSNHPAHGSSNYGGFALKSIWYD